MKALVLATLATLGLQAAAIPAGPDLARTYSAFEELEVDPQLGLADIASGHVTIGDDEVTLTLLARDANGTLQPVFGPTLKITGITNSCGSLIVRAKVDRRPVDGAMNEIVISDHRHRLCRDLVRHVTEVRYNTAHYDRLGGKEVTTSSYFGGPALQPSYE